MTASLPLPDDGVHDITSFWEKISCTPHGIIVDGTWGNSSAVTIPDAMIQVTVEKNVASLTGAENTRVRVTRVSGVNPIMNDRRQKPEERDMVHPSSPPTEYPGKAGTQAESIVRKEQTV